MKGGGFVVTISSIGDRDPKEKDLHGVKVGGVRKRRVGQRA